MYKQQLFNRIPFHEYQASIARMLKEEVQRQSLDELRDEATPKRLEEKYTKVSPSVDWDTLEITKKQEVEERNSFTGGTYRVTRCTFEVSLAGNEHLLEIQPTERRLFEFKAGVKSGVLSFDMTASENAEQNKAALSSLKGNIDFNLAHLAQNVRSLNATLKSSVEETVARRIEELEKHSSIVDSFGVPVRGQE